MKCVLFSSSGSNDGDWMLALPWTQANTNGSKTNTEKVDAISPPITALPNGDTWSPPSPNPIAIGNIPAVIASVVITIGRIRRLAAPMAAFTALHLEYFLLQKMKWEKRE